MNKYRRNLIGILCSIVILIGISSCFNNKPEQNPRTLPTSLNKLYPPVSGTEPVWLNHMKELAYPYEGIMIDVKENQLNLAIEHFNKMKALYQEVSHLVPEWTKLFPQEPIERLGKALKSGKIDEIQAAYDVLGRVCFDCHIENLPKVQHKYAWGQFHLLLVSDNLTNDIIKFSQYMKFMGMSLTAVSIDLEEGQVEQARKHFKDFNARFNNLESVCKNCHRKKDPETGISKVIKRKYFVDENIQTQVALLGQLIETDQPDIIKIKQVSDEIATDSCYKCHLVHVPATYSRYKWNEH